MAQRSRHFPRTMLHSDARPPIAALACFAVLAGACGSGASDRGAPSATGGGVTDGAGPASDGASGTEDAVSDGASPEPTDAGSGAPDAYRPASDASALSD